MVALLVFSVILLAQGYPTPQPVLIEKKIQAPAIFKEPSAPCTGVDPELLTAWVKSVARVGTHDHYTLSMRVKNAGLSSEPAGFPQRVDVFRDGHRVASVPVAHLDAGQARNVSTTVEVPCGAAASVFYLPARRRRDAASGAEAVSGGARQLRSALIMRDQQ